MTDTPASAPAPSEDAPPPPPAPAPIKPPAGVDPDALHYAEEYERQQDA